METWRLPHASCRGSKLIPKIVFVSTSLRFNGKTYLPQLFPEFAVLHTDTLVHLHLHPELVIEALRIQLLRQDQHYPLATQHYNQARHAPCSPPGTCPSC